MISAFDPLSIIDAFNDAKVDYVIVGAWAIEAQGVRRSQPTQDIDITPSMSPENLRAVSNALTALGARVRLPGELDGLPFDHDETSLARTAFWNLTCVHGDLDLCFTPAGFPQGYDDLVADSVTINLDGIEIRAASVRDVIRSKQEAGRPKDHEALPEIIEQATDLGLLTDDA